MTKSLKHKILFLTLFWTMLIFVNLSSFAQDLKQVTLQISFLKGSDGTRTAVVKAKGTDQNENTINITGLPIDFYLSNGGNLSIIEKINTDNDGRAVLDITKKIPTDPEGKINLTVKSEESNNYAPGEASGSVKDANIILTATADSSGKSIKAKVVQVDSKGFIVPLKDIEVTFYVKRLFGLMKLGDDAVSTDENGIASTEVPINIKENLDGTITVVAKIEDDETYGTIESFITDKMGSPVLSENDSLPRAFYTNKAPVWMLISFILIIAGISTTLLFVLYQLYKIRKEKFQNLNYY